MYLRYGNYAHQINEAAVSFTITSKFNSGGQVYQQLNRWSIQGLLLGDSATDLDTKWANLREAYEVQGLSIGLFHDDNSPTCRQLLTSQCIGGTRVVEGPTSQFEPGTHTTFIPYSIVVEGDIPDLGAAFISFHEEVTREGGGPMFLHLEPLLGLPVKQQVKTDTTYRVTQEGEAIGQFGYPTIPPPVLGVANLKQSPRVKLGSPKRSGPIGRPTHTEFPISWTYIFESAVQIPAIPNRWIG